MARLLLSVLTAVLGLVAPASAQAALTTAAGGRLGAFTGGVAQVGGSLTAAAQPYGSDPQTFAATTSGTGAGSLARGTINVHWKQGQSVAYGAALYLPPGFHAAATGQQALLRWDSFPGIGGRFEQGGVIVDYGDGQGYLIGASVTGGAVTQRVLAGPFPLPVGRWFTLQVRQLLGSGASAYSDVYEDGQPVATSRAPNLTGGPVNHVRYGIVQLTPDAAQGPVSLFFDQATAAGYTGYVNPLGGDRYHTGRTDMGVDFCLRRGEPVRALGDGVVVGINPNWFRRQPYLWYQLLDGPYAGAYVYVAEQITRLAPVGARLTAGQPLAYYKRSGTCLEMGWSAAGGRTLAQATTGYHEAQITRAGVSFARLLMSLGVTGAFELDPSR